MLVIHPEDRTTDVLKILYEELDAQVIVDDCSRPVIDHLLKHASTRERVMLLGHGSDKGLFFRRDDTKNEFDKVIVEHRNNFMLRRHDGNIIGIWCHANLFAQAEGLHGLFSGMMISEESEAEEYGIAATHEEILASNKVMFGKLRRLLDEHVPLHEIPARMRALDNEHTPLSEFNYGNFHYM